MCIDEVTLVKLLITECSSPMDNDKDRIIEQYFKIYNSGMHDLSRLQIDFLPYNYT